MLNKVGTHYKIDWNMGAFFLLYKFGKCIKDYGKENKPALIFWRKVINEFTKGNYLEEVKLVQMSDYKAERVIFEFGANI
ncbi:acetyltransferase [Rickettsia rhipicephali]|uniref:acetyltransferase n=1 Tax=Rickettsia rhipicephali TaxID=33992 RepID=UPI0022569909|nr:acetyltransferase [Rickettsia rhipicephali]MCX4079784.1 acetyltransferase [Rickettsia rhipicephali]